MNTEQKLEIIEDTRQWYTSEPGRWAFDPIARACRYRDDNGNKCAVGRYLPEDLEIDPVYMADGFQILVDEYASTLRSNPYFEDTSDDSFWITLQSCHDYAAFYSGRNLPHIGNFHRKLDDLRNAVISS